MHNMHKICTACKKHKKNMQKIKAQIPPNMQNMQKIFKIMQKISKNYAVYAGSKMTLNFAYVYTICAGDLADACAGRATVPARESLWRSGYRIRRRAPAKLRRSCPLSPGLRL